MNGYIAFYKGKQIEVQAETSYSAQKIAAEKFGVNKSYEVTVVLAEKNGEQVMHKASDSSPTIYKDGMERKVMDDKTKDAKEKEMEVGNRVDIKHGKHSGKAGIIKKVSHDIGELTINLDNGSSVFVDMYDVTVK